MTAIPASEVLTVEMADEVAIVWLDRPDKLNAMNKAFWTDIPAVMDALSASDQVRVVIIAGRGKAFTAGLDLVEFGPSVLAAAGGSKAASSKQVLADVAAMQRTFTSIAKCTKPVIAAVHGFCIGAGIDLITACDIRLATADSVFAVRETKIAIVADVGTLQRLPRIVDPGWAAELAYTGRDVSADEAKEMRLVTHVYEDVDRLHKEARDLAAQIAANSPLVVQGTKRVLQANDGRTVDQALEYVAMWNAAFLHSNDLAEAMAAYMEKRPPNFTGD